MRKRHDGRRSMNEIDYDTLECAIHHKLEPHQDGSIWCPECWHTYWDDAELIATELREWGSQWEGRGLVGRPTVSDILSCPLCLHDW
jgi:hypothetical protein